jgi:hypothetical protein
MPDGTLFLEVWGYDFPCARCQGAMTWVFGLRPWYRPKVGELVTCDQPRAVETARDILQGEGLGGLAAQLRSRPVRAQGTSFNPNTCSACGDQADWRVLDDVVNRALHGNFLTLARARVGVSRWRELIDERTYVIV